MGKKLKYRDVVKKTNSKQYNKKNAKKVPKERKKYSLYKPKGPFKRKSFGKEVDSENRKKFREEEKAPVVVNNPDSSSDSEEEPVDYLKLLKESFGDKIKQVSNSAISSDESESEEEENKKDGITDDGNVSEESDEEAQEDEEEELDLETQQEENNLENSKDPFVKHVSYELHPNLLEYLQSTENKLENDVKTWTQLGNVVIEIPKCDTSETRKQTLLDTTVYATPNPLPKVIDSKSSFDELHIKSQIASNIADCNKSVENKDTLFTPLQQEMFSIINNYQDFYFPERTFDNAEEIRFVYCLHALNHVLKTRTKVLHHNSKINKKEDISEDFRDQGLVRPKVLIVAPFKHSAYCIVNMIINLMFKEDKGNVIKKNRFIQDYTGNELYMPKKNPKPEDYEKTFEGNTSDDFKMGITVTKKSLKLYSDFYSSDIIVASPLGLRTIIGAQGEPDRDFDFLASIELLILDQADLFYVQNWMHVVHLFDHMHLKPKELHGTDISRIRQWCLNLWAKYYRQTLIFSAVSLPHIDTLFAKHCKNFAGKVKVMNKCSRGQISRVYISMQHVFRKFSAPTPLEMVNRRFEFFVQKVLPTKRDSGMKQTLIYIPSYYDFVKIRNYFKKEDLSFVQICEYSKDAKVARARDMFYHGDAHFMLYTERFHFYHRIRVKGIRHLIFYQPPTYPHFYSEMCNLMTEHNMNRKVGSMINMSVNVLYTQFDFAQLAPVVGTDRAVEMIQSDRNVHMLVTEAS